MQDFPLPTTKRQLREFLGLLSSYRLLVCKCAHIIQPLHGLLEATRGSSNDLPWCDEMKRAFNQSKQALANAALLAYPRPGIPQCLMVDASDIAIGAVLQQLSDSTWHPTAFFLRKLTFTERRYSTFGRELLAVYSSIRNFQQFLEGVEFFILTDHKPLTYALRSVRSDGGTHTAREIRQLAYISEFTTDILHVKGNGNVVADALSRSAINAVNDRDGVNFDALAAAKEKTKS